MSIGMVLLMCAASCFHIIIVSIILFFLEDWEGRIKMLIEDAIVIAIAIGFFYMITGGFKGIFD